MRRSFTGANFPEVNRGLAQAYLGHVANNEDPQSTLDALKSAPTVAQLAKAYIEGHPEPKKMSWREDESTLRQNLLPEFGTRLAHHLTSAELTAIHVRIGTKRTYAANELLNFVCNDSRHGSARGGVAAAAPRWRITGSLPARAALFAHFSSVNRACAQQGAGAHAAVGGPVTFWELGA